jgi:alkyl hydroperoxide reductase subunit AhpC
VFDSALEKFAALNAQVLDISIDSIMSHIAWFDKEIGHMRFPSCSDFYPHGAVVSAYGILRHGPPLPGISERAAFVVDKAGKIVFAKVYPLDRIPEVDAILAVLQELRDR